VSSIERTPIAACPLSQFSSYDHIVIFGETLPAIREHINRDLALVGLPYEKVLATVVRLLDVTLLRIGNEEYSRENDSYGLTTLQNRHVDISGSKLHFHFRGKSGKEHVIDVRDKQLAKIVRRCQDLPGYELFEYVNEEGRARTVDSSDVNEYLREISGHDFTAKDFRTWGGTVIVTRTLNDLGAFSTQTETKKKIVEAIKATAGELGDTPAICRKCYVHPSVIDAYMDGSLLGFLRQHARQAEKAASDKLSSDEAAVLIFFHHLSAESSQ
jgi:DNA topoisomerase-1